jgi:hypothetical protein
MIAGNHRDKPVIDNSGPSSTSRAVRVLAVLLLCLPATGCGKLARTMLEVSRLRAAIIKEYGEKEVYVNLHNLNWLVVTFANSPLNDRGPEERKQRAQQTAAFVKQHYSSMDKITEISVNFMKVHTRYVVVHYNEGLGFYSFDKNAQPLSPTATPDDLPDELNTRDESRPTAMYSESLKQTDVSITRLQLEGTLDDGLAMVPHFTVPGDATKGRRSPPPLFVSFDFASYSPKSDFPGLTKVRILADDKVILEETEVFSTSKSDDGTFREFLHLQFQYPVFKQMAAAEKSVVVLGSKQYELTDAQRSGLREMTGYVRE